MGTKKNNLLDKIREGDDMGRDAIGEGDRLDGEGKEIKSLLDSIDKSIDEDDYAQVTQAESGYQGDFTEAFDAEAKDPANEAVGIEGEAIDEAGDEQEKVEAASDLFSQMEGASDVGKGNADGGRGAMDSSANEYGDMIGNAEDISQEVESEISDLENSINNIFG